jgi:hypothetical protein
MIVLLGWMRVSALVSRCATGMPTIPVINKSLEHRHDFNNEIKTRGSVSALFVKLDYYIA